MSAAAIDSLGFHLAIIGLGVFIGYLIHAPSPRPWTQHLASDGAKPQVLGWYRRAKATKRGGMDGEESECLIVPPKRGN